VFFGGLAGAAGMLLCMRVSCCQIFGLW